MSNHNMEDDCRLSEKEAWADLDLESHVTRMTGLTAVPNEEEWPIGKFNDPYRLERYYLIKDDIPIGEALIGSTCGEISSWKCYFYGDKDIPVPDSWKGVFYERYGGLWSIADEC